MKFFNKKVLAAAVVGALASGNALAAAEIKTASTVFADEIVLGTTLTVPVEWTTGYNFSAGEVRYACLKLTGANFGTGTPTVDILDGSNAAATNVALGAVNVNDNVLFFSLTSVAGAADQIENDYSIVLSGTQVVRAAKNTSLTGTVGLYDNPSNAGECGTAGLVPGSKDTEELITFKKSYTFRTDPNKLVSSVEADPSFTLFTETDATHSSGEIGLLHALELELVTNPGLTADGVTPVTLADIFPVASTYTVTGDFSWVQSAGLDWSGVGSIVNTVSPDKLVSTIDVSNGFEGGLLVEADGETEIPVGVYTASLAVTPNTGYSLKADGTAGAATLLAEYDESLNTAESITVDSALQVAGAAGQIVQDGVRLQTPLVQLAGGSWLTRLVISNTGSKDREFTLKAYAEDGNSVTTPDTVYTVKAGTTYVFDDLSDVLSYTGRARGTVVAVVAGPQEEIKGVYQIVNSEAKTISNVNLINQNGGTGH